jgi:hypothetical protein
MQEYPLAVTDGDRISTWSDIARTDFRRCPDNPYKTKTYRGGTRNDKRKSV